MPDNPQQQVAQPIIDPMRGRLVAPASQGVPAGAYDAVFTGVEHRPARVADPMTGKGGQMYASMRFAWKIVGGQQNEQTAYRETPVSYSLKSKYGETIGWLYGAIPDADYDLTQCVNRRYRIVVSQKLDKVGKPTNYTQVTQCIAI